MTFSSSLLLSWGASQLLWQGGKFKNRDTLPRSLGLKRKKKQCSEVLIVYSPEKMVTCGSSRNDYRNLLKVRIFIFSLGSSSLKIDADSIPSVHNKRKLIFRPDSVPSAFLFQVSIISLIETESHGSFHIDRGSSPSSSAPPRCPPPPAMQPGELIAAAGAPAFSAIEPGGQIHLRNHVSAIARPIRMTLLLQLAATRVLLVQFNAVRHTLSNLSPGLHATHTIQMS